MKYLILLLLGTCIMPLAQQQSRGDEFTVEGIATLQPGKAEDNRPPVIFSLKLENRGQEYRITAKALDGTWFNNEVAASDGTLNYFLEQDWPSLGDKMKDTNYMEFGKVGADAFPEFSATSVQLAWLAYCSASHFAAGTNYLRMPISTAKYAMTNGLRQVVFFSESEPKLLDKIECFATNVLYVRTTKSNMTLAAPYDKGFRLWQLRITAHTNVGSLALPLAFEYDQYYPKVAGGTNSGDLQPLYHGKFLATNLLATVSAGKLLPVASKKDVRVADWSHQFQPTAGGTPVVAYLLNEDKWKGPADP